MQVPLQITIIRFALSLLVPIMILGLSSCAHTSDETWRCYDPKGNPVAGVLIISRYDLAADDRTGVNYRFSDSSGKITLGLDKDTPRDLLRCHECVYSSRLHSGDIALGQRWDGRQPFPDHPVAYDGKSRRIYLKDGTDQPLVWYSGVQELIGAHRKLARFPNGGARMAAELHTMIARERALFLQKYGDRTVPAAFFKTPTYRPYRDILRIDNSQKRRLTFKDITIPISKP